MFHTTLRTAAAALALVVLPLAGCDETGTGGSLDEQIVNARLARNAGDYDLAIEILEAAYAENPTNAEVRVEYGVTLLERDDLDLLDLDNVASYLSDASGTRAPAPAAASAARGGGSCPYASDPTATEFDPTDFEGFSDLEADRATIQQTLALLDPVIPDALQDFSLCTGIVDGPDGPVLNYDAAAALAEMRALGLSDAQISAALASNALARFLNAYLVITLDLPQEATWYRTNGGSGLGLCADDPDALLDQAEEAVADLGEAAFAIDLRAQTYGTTTTSQELVDLVVEGYTEVRDGIGDYCSN